MKVLVGLSGGVDSSTTAYLLKQQGHEVEGVYIKLHDIIPNYHNKNISKVQQVADYLNIKYHILDFSNDFNQYVYQYFVDGYVSGITPNPCVMCNKYIKFGKLIEFAKSLGIEYVATGHYANTDGTYIYKGVDDTKDQSYFLSYISHDVLPNILFPLGNMTKKDVKSIAYNLDGLRDIASGSESNEICFVENSYTDILNKHTNINKQGNVKDTNNNIIGTHKGYMHYTIGKRKGFSIQASVPHYVLNIDANTNEIIVGTKEQLSTKEFFVHSLNLYTNKTDFECNVKVRYKSVEVKCKVNITNEIAQVQLYEDIYAIAKGQLAVFYNQNQVIGSGLIV